MPYLQGTMHYLKKKMIKARVTHVKPVPWCGHHLTHLHSHITRADIRHPWTAVSAFIRPHQHGVADSCRGGFFQIPLSDSSKLLMYYFVSPVNTLLKKEEKEEIDFIHVAIHSWR